MARNELSHKKAHKSQNKKRQAGPSMYPDVALARRYTLVVGAGINAKRNVPGWIPLVTRAWREVFGEDADYRGDLTTRLNEARRTVQQHCGWTKEDAQRLDVSIHPLEPQFALELIDLHLTENPDVAERVRRLATETPPRVSGASNGTEDLLPILLVRCLYENVTRTGEPDTLSELAHFVRRSKRLVRVISLNVDNLLELEIENTRPSKDEERYLQVISRARHHPASGIPTYHLHGYLPINMLEDPPRWAKPKWRKKTRVQRTGQEREHMMEAVPERLVFTDTQYWNSVATPLSFTNFVFANALHDSSCIFIGLSMNDLNIIRWLGLYANEFRTEYEREWTHMRREHVPGPRPYIRHCWIRPDAADPTGLVTSFLSQRGVHSYQLPNWQPEAVRKALRELL
jgi:SIR2-like domain